MLLVRVDCHARAGMELFTPPRLRLNRSIDLRIFILARSQIGCKPFRAFAALAPSLLRLRADLSQLESSPDLNQTFMTHLLPQWSWGQFYLDKTKVTIFKRTKHGPYEWTPLYLSQLHKEVPWVGSSKPESNNLTRVTKIPIPTSASSSVSFMSQYSFSKEQSCMIRRRRDWKRQYKPRLGGQRAAPPAGDQKNIAC